MTITRHAEKRLRKRAGIKKSSVQETFKKALEFGKKQKDFKGAFRKYLDFWAIDYHSTPIVYQNTIYFIKSDDLITAWQVPQKYLKYIKD